MANYLAGGTLHPKALSELIMPAMDAGFANIAPLPCNVQAVEAALLFSTDHLKNVLISGPSGHGKSTIAKAAESYILQHRGDRVAYCSASELVQSKSLALSKMLIIDDAHEVLRKSKQKLQFRIAIEKRFRSGLSTMIFYTGRTQDSSLVGLMPSSRMWTKSHISEPSTQERELLVRHLSKVEQVTLSPYLVQIISSKIKGSGRVFQGSLHRLRLEQAEWLGPQNILKACGVLDPFFVDNSSWDLRHKIWKLSKDFCQRNVEVDAEELACFTMLKTACLAEDGVSRYLEQNPSFCYAKAQAFSKKKRHDPVASSLHQSFVAEVVAHLLQ